MLQCYTAWFEKERKNTCAITAHSNVKIYQVWPGFLWAEEENIPEYQENYLWNLLSRLVQTFLILLQNLWAFLETSVNAINKEAGHENTKVCDEDM